MPANESRQDTSKVDHSEENNPAFKNFFGRFRRPLQSVIDAWLRARAIYRYEGPYSLILKLFRIAIRPVSAPARYVFLRYWQRRANKELAAILSRHSGKTVFVFRPVVDWDLPLFQRPHQIAKCMAEHGFLYFFCVPHGGRDRVRTFQEVVPGCFVTPHFSLVDALPNQVTHIYSTDNACTVEWVQSHLKRGDTILYEYVDEIHADISKVPIPEHVYAKHRYLLSNRNVFCVATADKLYEEILSYRNERVSLITNGVERRHFQQQKNNTRALESIQKLVDSDRPIIGYFGALAKWVDYSLLQHLADICPEYHIVLIGPNYDDSLPPDLCGRPNVSYLGTIPYSDLPRYACWFSVSMIPFVVNEITASTSPIKLFEYMAIGSPIVTTSLPECRKYKSVLVANNQDEFVLSIEKALGLRNDPDYASLLLKEANENCWESKAEAIGTLIKPDLSNSISGLQTK